MKKLLFGVFAHPDDEAFGPSMFLHEQAQSGTDVHLILVTDGEGGRNEGYEDLAATRLEEWLESGRRIGATSNNALHYPDGRLCNDLYLEIGKKITHHIRKVTASYDEPVELSFLTFEERGITGHLDHIAVSFITTYCFECLKGSPPAAVTIGVLRYYCLPHNMHPACNCDWIYMPTGRSAAEIDEKVSYAGKEAIKITIMGAHVSQKQDMDYFLALGYETEDTTDVCVDHFIIRH